MGADMATIANETSVTGPTYVVEGLYEVIQAAHLASGAFGAANVWCMCQGLSKLHEIADRFDKMSAAMGLKVLEARRLRKALAAALDPHFLQSTKTSTPLGVDVRSGEPTRPNLGMKRKAIKHNHSEMRRRKFVSTLAAIPELKRLI